MLISGILNIFKKEHNVFAYGTNWDTKHLIQFCKEKEEARNYLKKLLDSDLKDYIKKTKDENTLANDYIKNKQYSYQIENDNFCEKRYIKENAPRIYKEYIGTIL